MKKLGKNLAMYICMFVAMFCAMTMKVEAENVTSGYLGANNGITWTYDADTKTLTITGEDSGLRGTWDNDVRTYKSPFAAICEDVEIIKVQNCTLKGSSYAVFAYLESLKSIEFINVNTTNVTSMDYMFSNCSSLSSLNLSNFDTSNVTDMSFMFAGCSSLSSLDISNFVTSQVTGMFRMFYNCSSLSSLDVSKFDTSKVTNMGYMFYGCSNLNSVDVSKFDTSQVTNMSYMFCGCSNLSSLNLSKFDTSNVKSMEGMFSKCKSLSGLDVSKFDTSKVTSMTSMFFDCENLSSLDVSKFNTSNVTSMYQMFYNCKSLSSLDVSKFDTSNVKSMGGMFFDCENLSSLDVSKFNTSNVTSMYQMFYNCKNLSSLDLSSFDLMKVTSANGLLLYCTNLACIETPKTMPETLSIDLPTTYVDSKNEQTTKLTKSFSNTTLKNVDFLVSEITLNSASLILHTGEDSQLPVTTSPGKVLNQSLIWESSDTTVAIVDANGKVTAVAEGTATITVTATDFWGTSVSASCEVIVISANSGYLGDNNGIFWTYDQDTKTMTITGEDSGLAGDTKYGVYLPTSQFVALCDDVEVIVLKDCTVIGDASGMFARLESLKQVKFDKFDTSQITDMDYMFGDCSGLKSLDVSGFKTSQVTDMTGMFSNCSGLKSLDVSGFDTSQVTGMFDMFYGCSGLTSLDVSDFDTSNVTNMSYMFYGCSGLTNLDVSGFDTSNVYSFVRMFGSCSGLTSLDVSNFDTSKVYTLHEMFYGCSSLTSVNVSGLKAENTTLHGMFQDCTSLESLDLSNFEVNNPNTIFGMFKGCTALKSLDLSGLDLASGIDCADILENCRALEVIYTPKGMGTENYINLPGTFANPGQKQTTVINKDFNNTTLVNVNNLVTGVSVSPASAELKPGDTKQLQATVTPTKAAIKDVTWKSSNTAVATVDATGKVTAVAVGTTTITATAKDGSGKSATCIVTVTEPVPETPEDLLKAFVERMYTVALGRAAETEGLNFYVQRLLSGDSNGACLAESFLCSPEFLNKGHSDAEYVKVLYRTFFDREPAAEEVNYWVDKLSNGQTKAFVLSGFVNSYEFDNLCAQYGISRGFMREDGKPLNPGIGRFAERMYTVVLERAGEKEGIEYWSLSIANGVCTPKDAAKNFFLSPEYVNKNTSDAQYITTLYKAFMDREPEAGGVEYWQNVLKNGATREQILEGFADSAEFKGIMASFGL